MEAVANLTKQEIFRFGMEKDKLRNQWCKLFQNFRNGNAKKNVYTIFVWGDGGVEDSIVIKYEQQFSPLPLWVLKLSFTLLTKTADTPVYFSKNNRTSPWRSNMESPW